MGISYRPAMMFSMTYEVLPLLFKNSAAAGYGGGILTKKEKTTRMKSGFSSCDKRISLIYDRSHLVEHSPFSSY